MSETVEQQMEDSNVSETPVSKKGFSLKVIIMTIIGLLVIGGGAFYILGINSPKAQYFLAEKHNLDQINSVIEERFGDELAWYALSQEKPIEQNTTLSIDIQDAYASSVAEMEIVNNSSVSINTVSDPKARQASIEALLDISGFKIDGLEFYITTEELIFKLPFLNDYIKIGDKDIGKISDELGLYLPQDSLGLDQFLAPNDAFNYDRIEKEYIKFIFESISKDAFTKTSDKIDLDGKEVKANKLEMVLNEKEIKRLMILFLEKLKNDKDIKALLTNSINDLSYGGFTGVSVEEEFVSGINDAIDEIKSSNEKGSLRSTIWVDAKNIVKRELEMTVDGETVLIEGEQLFKKQAQKWDYKISSAEFYGEDVRFYGELQNKDGKITDEITFSALDDNQLNYYATETRKGNDHQFERSIILEDYWDSYRLGWNGDTTFTNNKMDGKYDFHVNIGEDEMDIALFVKVDGEVVKKVTLPAEKDTVDLGSMNQDQLYEYYEKVSESLYQWMDGDIADLMYELDPYGY